MFKQALSAANQQKRAQHLWRSTELSAAGMINFCSNDYLNLSRHPHIVAAYQQGLAEYGCGSGGSPLLSGYQRPHHRLREVLSEWLQRESVLLFNSGYAANQALGEALSHFDTQFVFDKRNHASMYDALHPSRAPLLRFNHNDTSQLRQRLQQVQATTAVIASEGVFSMDGDRGAVAKILDSIEDSEQPSLLWIDDAHGIGMTGDRYAGVAGDYTQQQVPCLTATFGKAFGIGGALLAGGKDLMDWVQQSARHYIYSTAFSAAQACAVSAALKVIQTDAERHQRLAANIQQFAQGVYHLGWRDKPPATTMHAIQPVHCGSNEAALALSQRLAQHGIQCSAVRPPTVPQGQARLRFTITAGHSRQEIDQALEALGYA